MKLTGTLASCIAAVTASPCVSAAATPSDAAATAATVGVQYYQPKETSDLVYTGLPRFQKGETINWSGMAVTGFLTGLCAKSGVLLGANNLIAGAAVAFGAATLAF